MPDSKPAFQRGAPATPNAPASDGTWLAKYDGTCAYCQVSLSAGKDRVKWNEGQTAVVCSHHKGGW